MDRTEQLRGDERAVEQPASERRGSEPEAMELHSMELRSLVLERIAMGAVALTGRALARRLPGLDLTLPQWRAFLIVGESPDGTRVGRVAARVGVTLPATSRLLRRLERRGLLSLSEDAEDRRATRVRLTAEGDQARAAILADRRAALREIGAALEGHAPGSLDETLEQLAAELDRYR